MKKLVKPIIECIGISKKYFVGDNIFYALKDVNLSIEPSEFVAILGPSGSGKTTLMSIMGCLEEPSMGDYILDGISVKWNDRDYLAYIRNYRVGFIFQNFHLISHLNVLDNVQLPLIYRQNFSENGSDKSMDVLNRVGLNEKLHTFPETLSGGQKQRVSIARALVTDPAIILADEPTGSLDQKTGHEIIDIFKDLTDTGKTVVMITHDIEIAKKAHRIIYLEDGKIR